MIKTFLRKVKAMWLVACCSNYVVATASKGDKRIHVVYCAPWKFINSVENSLNDEKWNMA